MKAPGDLQQVAMLVGAWKASGKTVGFANGAFDLLHVGHVRYLQGARAEVDALVVAINSDQSVKQSKGPSRPLIPESERAEMVRALACVDHAFIFTTSTVDSLLETIRPHVHFKGTDYTAASVPEAATAKRLGIAVRIVGDPKDHSTTALVGKLGT